ncbi:hypothetical protein [Vibrio sp. HN007]|uniref:hypothetical protein n=1 Tax=Vibrio iocasae TaxID=3098914 RepID=UPI0035D5246A
MMLFIVTTSMASSNVGKLRSHGVMLMVQVGHGHSHSGDYTHLQKGEYQYQHDASNHTHDNVTLDEISKIAFEDLTKTENSWRARGSPVHKPFKIERPPRGYFSRCTYTTAEYVVG